MASKKVDTKKPVKKNTGRKPIPKAKGKSVKPSSSTPALSSKPRPKPKPQPKRKNKKRTFEHNMKAYVDAFKKILKYPSYQNVYTGSQYLRNLEDCEEFRHWSLVFKNLTIKMIDSCESEEMRVKWYELYRRILLIRAPYLFDDFMLYIEIDRPAEERFYQPRRLWLKEIVDALQDLNDDFLDELMISQPPRTGKSSLIMFFILWQMGKDPEQSMLYSAYSDVITRAMYNGILEVTDDAFTYKFKDVFPKFQVIKTDAKNETIDIGRAKRYPTATFRSLYGTLNGACDANGYLISDDLIGSIEEALNKDRMMGAWSKVTNNLLRRAKETCKILWVGTRWSIVDPTGLRLDFLENDPKARGVRYKIINVPALDENDESNFDYDYGVGFSTEYYQRERAQFERNNDMASWLAQFMGEPIEREGALFESAFMNYYNGTIEDEITKRYMVVDVAWGGGDYLSAPIAYDTDDSTYIVDWVFSNDDKFETRPLIIDAIIRNNVSDVTFESNNGGTEYGEWIDEQLREKGYKCTIRYQRAPSTKAKQDRIYGAAPEIRLCYFIENGKRTKEYQLAMNNMFSFKMIGKNKHDDAPDSMAMLITKRNNGMRRSVEFYRRSILGI